MSRNFISTLYIDIKNHNLTKITFDYFNDLLNINRQGYELLSIKFGPSINELNTENLNDFLGTELLGIYIEIVCEVINEEDQNGSDIYNTHSLYDFHDDKKDYETSIKYSITSDEIQRTGPKTCQKFHSEKWTNLPTTFISTSNIPIQSLSDSTSSQVSIIKLFNTEQTLTKNIIPTTITTTSNTPVESLSDSTSSQISTIELFNTEETSTKNIIPATITTTSVTTEMTSSILTRTTTLLDKMTTITTTIISTTTTITKIESTMFKTALTVTQTITTETQIPITLTSMAMSTTAVISTIPITILTITTKTISSKLMMTAVTSFETTRQILEKTITTGSRSITTTKQFKPQTIFTIYTSNRETTFITTEKSALNTKTTTKTIFYTNLTTRLFSSSTQSSSQTNFFLLSLLCILFILIICVVLISLWTFFRHNYLKRNKIDQNLNMITNIEISTIQSFSTSNTFLSSFIK